MIRPRRDSTTTPHPVAGVVRVECLGDSMMYGDGVLSDQAFPPRLEHHLNTLLPSAMVEAVNRGVDGGNLWNAWAGFESRFHPGDCDLVVVSVCHNDHRLLGWWGAPYDDDDDDSRWDQSGPWRDLMLRLLDDIDTFVAEHGIPVVLYHVDIRERCVAAAVMARLFGGRLFHFVDAASQLRDYLAPIPPEHRQATPFDGHPSPHIQDMLARHVAQYLRKHRVLGDIGTAPPITALLDRMVAEGGAIGDALAWGERVLAAKEPVWRRAAALDRHPDGMAGLTLAKDILGKRGEAWARSLHLGHWSSLTQEGTRAISAIVTDIEWSLNLAEELALVLRLGHADPDQAELLSGLLAGTATPPDAGRWPALLDQMQADLAAAAASFAIDDPGPLGPMGERLRGEQSGWYHQMRPLFGTAAGLLERLRRLAAMAEGGRPGGGSPDRVGALCLRRIDGGLRRAAELISLLSPPRPREALRFARHTTRIEVTLSVARPTDHHHGGLQLHLGLHYRLPSRLSLTAAHNLGTSAARHTYSFDFPLILRGELSLDLVGRPERLPLADSIGLTVERIVARNVCADGDRVVVVERPLAGPIEAFTTAGATVEMI